MHSTASHRNTNLEEAAAILMGLLALSPSRGGGTLRDQVETTVDRRLQTGKGYLVTGEIDIGEELSLIGERSPLENPVVQMAREQVAQELAHHLEIVVGPAGMGVIVAELGSVVQLPARYRGIEFGEGRAIDDLLVRRSPTAFLDIEPLQRRPVSQQAMASVPRREPVLKKKYRLEKQRS